MDCYHRRVSIFVEKPVCQPSKSAHPHPHCRIVTLNVTGADVLPLRNKPPSPSASLPNPLNTKMPQTRLSHGALSFSGSSPGVAHLSDALGAEVVATGYVLNLARN